MDLRGSTGYGEQSRDFTYVDDIARGNIAGLKPVGYEIINLGSDTPVVLMDSIRLIEELVGKDAILDYQPRYPTDVLATWADIKKAKELLGWEPKVSYKDGIKRIINWYQVNRDWAKDVKTE